MAASNVSKVGYTCEFLDTNLQDYYCQLCQYISRDPHITSCCGEHFCQTCITPFLQEKQPCPTCSSEEFTTLLNVKYQQKILELDVCCTFRESGCKWTGKLSLLENHTDFTAGDCQHIETDCPKKCGRKVQKHAIATHLKSECFQRNYTCPYCNYKDTYETVSNKHMVECPYFPLRCPNFCGVTCERSIMEDHMKICPLQKIECELSFTGCKEVLLRDEKEKHMTEYSTRHLSLLSVECLKMKKEFELKMEEKNQAIQNMQESFSRQLQAKEIIIQELRDKMQLMDKSLQNVITAQTKITSFTFPFNFMISNYRKQKESGRNRWVSDYIGSHPKGYTFYLIVHLNGVGEGAGTHLSLSISPRMSVIDGTLKWPAKCTITVQLMNHHHNHDHLTFTDTLTWERPSSSFTITNFCRLFVKNDDLLWNA